MAVFSYIYIFDTFCVWTSLHNIIHICIYVCTYAHTFRNGNKNLFFSHFGCFLFLENHCARVLSLLVLLLLMMILFGFFPFLSSFIAVRVCVAQNSVCRWQQYKLIHDNKTFKINIGEERRKRRARNRSVDCIHTSYCM